MKKKLGLCVLGTILAFAAAAGVATAADEVTMEGTYVWAREDGDKDGPIKAVFTPADKGSWNVKFYFDWDDGPHVYSGTCSGSLEDGELEGDITSDGEREMKFKFSGTFADGTFSGTHAFVNEDGGLNESGTITFARK